jgi:hypothetical protein
MNRTLLVGILLLFFAGAYRLGDMILEPTQDQSVYIYTLRSGDLEELRHFAPLLAAQMRQLPMLRNISFAEETKGPQSKLGVGKVLSTVTISFRVLPNASLGEVIAQVSTIEKRLGLPSTIQTALSKAPTEN